MPGREPTPQSTRGPGHNLHTGHGPETPPLTYLTPPSANCGPFLFCVPFPFSNAAKGSPASFVHIVFHLFPRIQQISTDFQISLRISQVFKNSQDSRPHPHPRRQKFQEIPNFCKGFQKFQEFPNFHQDFQFSNTFGLQGKGGRPNILEI